MFLVDLILPKACRHCGDSFRSGLSNILCGSCFDSVEPYRGILCRRCGVPLPGGAFEGSDSPYCRECGEASPVLEGTRSFGDYAGPLRIAHHAFKFEGMEGLAQALAQRMAAELEPGFSRGLAALVPVPLSPERERERGYHPVRLLARALSSRMGMPVLECLAKTRPTAPQVSLSREKRLSNPKGAYRVIGPPSLPEGLLLVDDVLTTGATLEECARALKGAGVRHVRALVLGRTPLHSSGGPA